METMLMGAGLGVAGAGGGLLAYHGVKKGASYVKGKVSKAWNGGLNTVKADIEALQKDIAAIKAKVGL